MIKGISSHIWISVLICFCLLSGNSYGQDILWGVTSPFALSGGGTIFSVKSTGTDFTIKHAFQAEKPEGTLTEGNDGFFYGITKYGGAANKGTIYKLKADGTRYTQLRSLNGSSDGANPRDRLTEGNDGFLYGITYQGGSTNYGTFFRIKYDGSGFMVLKDFPQGAGNPIALKRSRNGYFYGISLINGGIFKIQPDGSGFTILKEFITEESGYDIIIPQTILEGSDGLIYGILGEDYRQGYNYHIFKMNADGSGFTALKEFSSNVGLSRAYSLIQGKDGFLYGTTYSTIFKIKTDGSGFTHIKTFNATTEGTELANELTESNDGFLYGSSRAGGSSNGGTLFKIKPDGTNFTILRHFSSADDIRPVGSLTFQKNTLNNTLPSPWKNGDIGAVALAGSANYSNGLFTLKSGGYDFYKAPDAFHYVYQPFTGNATIIAKVESMGNTHPNALAGVMIRQDNSPSASFVAVAVTPSGNTNFMWRQGSGTPGYKSISGTAPRWLKLERSGNVFTAYYSVDGSTWTLIGVTTITMSSNIYVGMALTSQSSQYNTATFSNVAVSTTPASSTCTATGTILREVWLYVNGGNIVDIPLTKTPSSTSQITSFETAANTGDNYGQRIRGYICPPVSGSYTFYVAADDQAELWMSTNDSPASKQKIASVTSWTNPKQWTKYASQKSVTISLEKGKKYYIEALHKEAVYGDNLAVGWTVPGSSSITVIPGAVLSPFDPSNQNQPPKVSISSPYHNQFYVAPATIQISATASDADGTVSKVEFYRDQVNKIGEDTNGSDGYNYTWTNVPAGSYTIVVKATDNLNASSSSVRYITVANPAPPCAGNGSISREYWANVAGKTVAEIPVNTTPTSTSALTSFEAPSNISDNYGQRIRGYLCVPVTAYYYFAIASDDQSELYLSTNENPANKVKIASVTGYTSSRQWTKYTSQQSRYYYLESGKKYYIEALHKEATGDDNLAVAWKTIGNPFELIPGKYLSPFAASAARLASEVDVQPNGVLAVYPNPFEDKLTITTQGQQGKVVISLMDVVGKAYFRKEYALSGQAEIEIDLSATKLKAGMHLLKLQTEDGQTQIFKIVKK